MIERTMEQKVRLAEVVALLKKARDRAGDFPSNEAITFADRDVYSVLCDLVDKLEHEILRGVN